jgi:hypothetical protein
LEIGALGGGRGSGESKWLAAEAIRPASSQWGIAPPPGVAATTWLEWRRLTADRAVIDLFYRTCHQEDVLPRRTVDMPPVPVPVVACRRGNIEGHARAAGLVLQPCTRKPAGYVCTYNTYKQTRRASLLWKVAGRGERDPYCCRRVRLGISPSAPQITAQTSSLIHITIAGAEDCKSGRQRDCSQTAQRSHLARIGRHGRRSSAIQDRGLQSRRKKDHR